MSKNADEFAATETLPSKSISLSNTDAVIAEVVGLQTTMFVTTAVDPDGVVYRVVVVVDAVPRNNTLDAVAISYYAFL